MWADLLSLRSFRWGDSGIKLLCTLEPKYMCGVFLLWLSDFQECSLHFWVELHFRFPFLLSQVTWPLLRPSLVPQLPLGRQPLVQLAKPTQESVVGSDLPLLPHRGQSAVHVHLFVEHQVGDDQSWRAAVAFPAVNVDSACRTANVQLSEKPGRQRCCWFCHFSAQIVNVKTKTYNFFFFFLNTGNRFFPHVNIFAKWDWFCIIYLFINCGVCNKMKRKDIESS